MEFFNREAEIELLEEARRRSMKSSVMTVITGRRRIGKTTLALKAFDGQPLLYFFVSRKNESLLCQEYLEEIRRGLGMKVMGEFPTFTRLFEYLLNEAATRHFTLVIDEFQEFFHVNRAVYGEMQNLWDRYGKKSKMNLVLSGSSHSMMKKIFEDMKEPLFGRNDERIILKPFHVEALTSLLLSRYPATGRKDILSFYVITGGVAKYVEYFIDRDKVTFSRMIGEIFRENSMLLDEGKNVLIEEFGKDHAVYFSILSLIASSRTSRPEIESVLRKDAGGYLDRLENEYMLIRSIRPILAKPGGRVVKYSLNDNFLSFWFRFVYKYRSAIETGNFEYLKMIVNRDFDTYAGHFLEKFLREKLALSGSYTGIGSYWERAFKNELDIVAINEPDRSLLIAEVKMNRKNFRPDKLKENSLNLVRKLPGYKAEYRSFSLDDI